MYRQGLAAAALLFAPLAAVGQVSLISRAGFLEATTSFNEDTETAARVDFAHFEHAIDLAVQFPQQGGGIATNQAFAGIDCEIDPNRVRLVGQLGGAGGVSQIPGFPPEVVDGNGAMEVAVLFEVTQNLPFVLTALARPSADPRDEFKLKFSREDGAGETIFLIDESHPAQPVHFTGTLEPGIYEIEYEVELTVEGEQRFEDVAFMLSVAADPACAADFNTDGVVNSTDVSEFINHWFEDQAAGTLGTDWDGNGVVNSTDVSEFINSWFGNIAAGCG